MYYEKAEAVRNEIEESLGERRSNDHSMFILFFIFIGCFFMNAFGVVKFLLDGLCRFIEYGYYRFMAWEDAIEKKREAFENRKESE